MKKSQQNHRKVWGTTAGAIIAMSMVPALASANALESADYELGDEEIAVRLTASAELAEPIVRSERGRVRVWFPGMSEDVRLDPVTDGHVIRHVRIRPGFADTSVINIRLGDGRTVPTGEVRVERSGSSGTIFIPRSVLPAAPSPAPAEIAAPEEAAAPAPAETEAQDETAAPAAVAEEDATPAASEQEEATVQPIAADSTSGMGVLVFISLLLGGVYFAMKQILAKKKRGPQADIQIISAKRLGNRHQIVLVRALGEDHLLSINGQNTHCITSTPTVLDDELAEDSVERESGILAKIRDHIDPTSRVASAIRSEQEVPSLSTSRSLTASKSDDDTTQKRFGAELFKFALENENAPAPKIQASRIGKRRGESEAVAGLVKLRERLAQSA